LSGVGTTTPSTDSSLAERLRRALDNRPHRSGGLPPGRDAAVLIMLFERDGEPWMVFTRRTHTVQHHKGEISFPGGARDPEDPDLEATAIRETVEELGIDPSEITIVGRLDELPTYVTGYNVTPFVAVIPEPHAFRPSHHEIDEVIELPVSELVRVGRREDIERQGFTITTNVFETGGHYIWGFTGAVLRLFLDEIWSTIEPPQPAAENAGG
jgi:8-oxo-dGTP pyrophosphatase MutT (NUDIX family)